MSLGWRGPRLVKKTFYKMRDLGGPNPLANWQISVSKSDESR